MAPPKAGGDLYYIARSVLARTQTDWRGRLLYSVRRPLPPNLQKPPEGNDTTGATQITLYPDSAPILRADFETRTIDTIAMFRIPVQKGVVVNQGGVYTGMMAFNPIPTSDEWVVLPDGAIAIVRAFDYHVDWLLPDGTRKSSPRMPFDWRRITPEDKVRILDSVREAAGALRAKFATSNPAPPPMMNGRPAPRIPFTTVEPDELPDFYPPIRMGQVRADLDGNVWILPATSTLAQPGLVYDVVNRAGAVFQRIRLPEGRNLVGFGPRGIVYLSYTRAPGWTLLEKATIGR
jgi:hypothetical protein